MVVSHTHPLQVHLPNHQAVGFQKDSRPTGLPVWCPCPRDRQEMSRNREPARAMQPCRKQAQLFQVPFRVRMKIRMQICLVMYEETLLHKGPCLGLVLVIWEDSRPTTEPHQPKGRPKQSQKSLRD